MVDPSLELLRELPPRARRWSLALILLCGSTLGYFVLHTFATPLHRQYRLDFGAAQWIEPAEFAPVAYFRKQIFLNAAPEQAWLQVAATDSFVLIINDRRAGTEISLKTRVAQIYDIKKFLKPGTNVIAIAVTRYSYPGSAQLLVCGGFKEAAGLSPSARGSVAKCPSRHDSRTPHPHYLGRRKSAIIQAAAIRQMDCGQKHPARGSFFGLRKCGKGPPRDMDSSGEFGKSRSSRKWKAHRKRDPLRVQRTKRSSFAPTDRRASREGRTNASTGDR